VPDHTENPSPPVGAPTFTGATVSSELTASATDTSEPTAPAIAETDEQNPSPETEASHKSELIINPFVRLGDEELALIDQFGEIYSRNASDLITTEGAPMSAEQVAIELKAIQESQEGLRLLGLQINALTTSTNYQQIRNYDLIYGQGIQGNFAGVDHGEPFNSPDHLAFREAEAAIEALQQSPNTTNLQVRTAQIQLLAQREAFFARITSNKISGIGGFYKDFMKTTKDNPRANQAYWLSAMIEPFKVR
jgi:hypothetical protein